MCCKIYAKIRFTTDESSQEKMILLDFKELTKCAE